MGDVVRVKKKPSEWKVELARAAKRGPKSGKTEETSCCSTTAGEFASNRERVLGLTQLKNSANVSVHRQKENPTLLEGGRMGEDNRPTRGSNQDGGES